MKQVLEEIKKAVALAEGSDDPAALLQYADRIHWLAKKAIVDGGGEPTPLDAPIPPCPGC